MTTRYSVQRHPRLAVWDTAEPMTGPKVGPATTANESKLRRKGNRSAVEAGAHIDELEYH